MSEGTLARIASVIKVEDDLHGIEQLRLQIRKEKASVDVKLNTTTLQQVDSISNNLNRLNLLALKLTTIKTNLEKINGIHNECITNVPDYETLRAVTLIYSSMKQTQSLYTDIGNFKRYLAHISDMIDAELAVVRSDIGYELYNTLRIHFNVTQARNLADYMDEEARKASDDMRATVRAIAAPLKGVIRKFDMLLKEVVISVTEAVKEGNEAMAKVLVRIISYEMEQDARCVLVRELAPPVRLSNYAQFRGLPRNYRQFFFSSLEDLLVETFRKCVAHYAHDQMAVYENLQWMEDELVFVERTLNPLFPPQWGVSRFIEQAYYNQLHKFTMEVINSNPPAEDLMAILAFDTEHAQFLEALYGLPRLILGDELRNSVLDDYLKVIVYKMIEWNETLLKQEKAAFTARSEPPETYSYLQQIEDLNQHDELVTEEVTLNVYVLPDFKTGLAMFKDQADVAAALGYGRVLVGVVENWAGCERQRIDTYTALVHDQVANYFSVFSNDRLLIKESKTLRFLKLQKAPPERNVEALSDAELHEISRPGLVEYLAALGNTYEINGERLSDKFLPSYTSKVLLTYVPRIEQAITDVVLLGYDLNALVIRLMANIVFNDLLPALAVVFTKQWYDPKEKNMAERIVDTIVEWMEDIRQFALYDMYLLTFTLVLDVFIPSYVRIGYQNILHGDGRRIGGGKLRLFADAITRDIDIFYNGLEHLVNKKEVVYLMKSLSAIDFLGTLSTEPLLGIPAFWELVVLEMYHDCPLAYVRGILECRKDVEPKSIPPLMEELAQIKRQHAELVPPPETPVNTLNGFTFS